MQTKTGQDLPILKLSIDNYLVPAGEEHLYHCRIEVKKFDTESGQRLSIPRIQKFGATAFTTSIHSNLKKQGFTVDILHNPSDWIKQQSALKQTQAENAQALKEQQKAEAATNAAAETQKLIDEAVAAALQKQGQTTQQLIDAAVEKALAAKANKTEGKAKGEPEAKTEGNK